MKLMSTPLTRVDSDTISVLIQQSLIKIINDVPPRLPNESVSNWLKRHYIGTVMFINMALPNVLGMVVEDKKIIEARTGSFFRAYYGLRICDQAGVY